MPCRIYKLDFLEKKFESGPELNLGSPDHLHVKSGKRLVFIVSRGAFEHWLGWELGQLNG